MISIQQYRMSVGSFHGGKHFKHQSCSKHTIYTNKMMFTTLLFFLFMSLFKFQCSMSYPEGSLKLNQRIANNCTINHTHQTHKQQNKDVSSSNSPINHMSTSPPASNSTSPSPRLSDNMSTLPRRCIDMSTLHPLSRTISRLKQSSADNCYLNIIHMSHKKRNKLVHMLEGNRNSKGYKLTQWNCGSAFLENKMPEVEAAVAKFKPTVFCVSESNLRSTTDQSEVQIPGYKLLTSRTILNPNLKMSRVVVYLDKSVKGKIREDLMVPNFSSI